jgi:hypothetical protein
VTLTIEHVSEASSEQWKSVWLACEYATFFHSLEWAEVWESYSRGSIRPAAKLIAFPTVEKRCCRCASRTS